MTGAGYLAGTAYHHVRGGHGGTDPVTAARTTVSGPVPGSPGAGASAAVSAGTGTASPGGRSASPGAPGDRGTASASAAAVASAEGAVPGAAGPGPGTAAGTGTGAATGSSPGPATMHVALNTGGGAIGGAAAGARTGDRARAAALGYDLFDVGPDPVEVGSLPGASRALVWAGNTGCGAFSLPYDRFTAAVDRLAANPRVYGWYLSDEPHPATCPGVVREIRRRADYVRSHAPGQMSYASMSGGSTRPLRPLRPAASHLDLIGLRPQPCRTGRRTCDLGTIDRMVRRALHDGFGRQMIVPVFQVSGQSCARGRRAWRLPEAGELAAMLDRWARLVPSPAFDVSYTWGRQRERVCPALADADGGAGRPDLQAVMKAHNLSP